MKLLPFSLGKLLHLVSHVSIHGLYSIVAICHLSFRTVLDWLLACSLCRLLFQDCCLGLLQLREQVVLFFLSMPSGLFVMCLFCVLKGVVDIGEHGALNRQEATVCTCNANVGLLCVASSRTLPCDACFA